MGLIGSIEFLKMLLALAREAARAERTVVPEEEIDRGRTALTELFNGVRNEKTPIIVERIVSCYKEFEARVTIAYVAGAKSTSYDVVKAYISERIGKFSKQEVLAGCPSLGSSSVESALKKLVEDGTLVRIGAGRKTLYVRAD